MGPTPVLRRRLEAGLRCALPSTAMVFGVLLAPAAFAQQAANAAEAIADVGMAAPLVLPASSAASSLPDSPGFMQAAAAEKPASIVGTIFDVNGGLVPGATITVLDKDGKTVATVQTDAQADFQVPDLAPGTYRVRIAATGLESYEAPAVALKAGERYELPQTALPIATANQTVNVVLTQSMIADLEIAEETKQRVLGIFPAFYTSYQWNAAPMNARQKFKLSFRSVTDPIAFITPAIVAGIEQAHGTYAGYGFGAEGYGKRYAAAYGDAFIGRFIGYAVLPSIFRQDPRYFFMGPPSTKKQRFKHAIAFSVLARSDRGHDGHLMPAYSHILGNFIAGYISKTYHPDETSGLGLATANALIGIGGSAVQGLVREFVFVRFTAHKPKHPLGKQKSDMDDGNIAPPAPAAAK